MINLRTPFWRWYSHIIQNPVLILRQAVELPSHDLLTYLAFRWNKPSEQEEEAKDDQNSKY